MNILPLTVNVLIQSGIFLLITILLIKPIGNYMARVYNDQFIMLEKVLGPIESFFYKILKINPTLEMRWQEYAYAMIIFSFINFVFLFAILRFQAHLPLNPQNFSNLSSDLAFNITASFITNTNWQSYSGEITLSYFSQMLGLTVQNFLSAGIGIAVAIALIRGLTRKNCNTIGNFWVDLIRGNLYILLPFSLILAILLVTQGVIQNFHSYVITHPLDNAISSLQTIPQGPVASQVAIKQLGSNGGGFFGTNSAYPFENPTPLSNLFELIAIILIPSALCYTFGVLVNDKRQGIALLIAMFVIYIPFLFFNFQQEQANQPLLTNLHIDQNPNSLQPGGNMEGKELRFGIIHSTLWTSTTTATSNGSVNSALDSYTPLGGAVPLSLILLGEIIFGGVGSGLYGILIFVILTVFIAGLMVGRTPEYLGKKIQSFEIKMSSLVILIPVITLLLGTTIAIYFTPEKAILNPGSQGFSEIFYALASTSQNNGSAFSGLDTQSSFYNTLLGIVMLFSRYWVMISILAIAGSLAEKNTTLISSGTLLTYTPLFISFLIGIILIIGLLTYIPALTLGPISEYFTSVKT